MITDRSCILLQTGRKFCFGKMMFHTLNTRLTEVPTTKRKNGITKSASVTPNHGEWFIAGKYFPASSTKIISCERKMDEFKVNYRKM